MIFDKNIIPHVWFDTQALDAIQFYCSIFPKSKIISQSVIKNTPTGDCDIFCFEIWGHRFEAINAGPHFELNPSISMMVNFDPLFFKDQANPGKVAHDKLNEIWKKLSQDGEPLLELGVYDFSPLYGWIKDKYGMTWQLILTDSETSPRPPIMPSMLFVGDNCGKAEEAGDFYRSLFPGSEMGLFVTYPADAEPDNEGTVMFSDFTLGTTWITTADSNYDHDFQFNEAVSFIIYCDKQEEIDYFWKKLSSEPEAEQCGWLKDKYGVFWQVVPEEYNKMMNEGTEEQISAVTKALLEMKKIDISVLRKAWRVFITDDAGN